MKTTLILSTLIYSFGTFANADVLSLAAPVSIRTTNTISTQSLKMAQPWVGSIAQDVVRDGRVIITKGTPVTGVLENSPERPKHAYHLKLVAIGNQTVDAEFNNIEDSISNRPEKKKVTGWAITGALVGGVLYGPKGIATGAAAGAGVGILRSRGQKVPAVIPAESLLTFQVK